MQLELRKTDARTGGVEPYEVLNASTQQVVGKVLAGRRSPYAEGWEHNRSIDLFGGKYKGDFNTDQECVAFIKGVEAVLNHLISMPDDSTKSAAA